LELEAIPLSLTDIVEAVGRILISMAYQRQIDLKIYVDPQIPDGLIGDPVRLRQILYNLAGNAIKFTPVGGVISITATEFEHEIEFCIQDSGVGMNQEQIDNILKGVQFTTRGTNREKGRGFGMVLVSEFLTKHKSTLHIESTLGKGTRFTFKLPTPPTN
jgi:signal transduction histidine kinase